MTEQQEFVETELSVIADDNDELEPQSLEFEDDERSENVEPMAQQEEPTELDEQVSNEMAVTDEQVRNRFVARNESAE